jgi:hypothetical protein
MFVSYIKYLSIMVCSIYTFKKLLNLKLPVKYVYIDFIFTLLLSLALYVLRVYITSISIPVLIILTLFFLQITTKAKLELSITTTILAFGISYALSAASAVLTAALFKLLGVEDSALAVASLAVATALIQFILIVLPFRFRRLKNGMPFLKSKGGSNAGVLISVILLSLVILSSNNKNADLYYVIPIVFILISAVLILFWWRSRLTRTYIERLRAEEIRRLENTVRENEERIGQLEAHNEALAKIIHKDNKLIPAMELSVREYLQSSERADDALLQEKGQRLLEHLKTMTSERTGIISDYRSSCKKLPSTDVVAVDAVLNYMFGKARENGIEFELTISGSVKYMADNVVSADDLTTLLADLIENAITATKLSANKKILVLIGIVGSFYMIDVFDSGIPFEPDTLTELGLKKTTTHAESGGSGIGMMTTFEILRRYQASFIIEEYTEPGCIYTKKVSVVFDRLNQLAVTAGREDEINTIVRAESILIGK